MKRIIPLACLIVAMLPGPASAAIVGLSNTGFDSMGNLLGENSIDGNYTIISGPITGDAIVATSVGGFPIPPWTPDSATSAWIAPFADTEGPNGGALGNYVYRTTFTVSDPATDVISGLWSTDNAGVDIVINRGTINEMSLGVTTAITSFATGFSMFSINSGLIAGLNTLDFEVNNADAPVIDNAGGPTGLRVELTASVIPLPAAIWLFGSGLLGLLALRRNKTA